ncbi:hypothetical protein H0H93_015956 [Arthromyces matolae]|nr:hypothetical protein H0H93_015956 [Arthromyces matolae]
MSLNRTISSPRPQTITQHLKENVPPFSTPNPRLISCPSTPQTPSQPSQICSDKQNRPRYRNGYVSKPQTPSYKPYSINNLGHPRQKAFVTTDFKKIQPLKHLSADQWNCLAWNSGILDASKTLRAYQIESSNVIIQRHSDLCVIAPTGMGKSLVWVLPLLAQKSGISLVIIPYTSLGHQGVARHAQTPHVKCTFLHSGGQTDEDLRNIIQGGAPRVIYSCVEMLETPSIARLLHSDAFQAQLSAVYIDEAHVVKECVTWRPGYSRIHILRKILGTAIPLVVLSATLPYRYRVALENHTGLRSDYHLINLGCYRPELSIAIVPMIHEASSFLDLSFVLPWGATVDSIPSTIIYADDLDLLTAMFWWFHARLGTMGLPHNLVDILHAGLSDAHQHVCTKDFIAGKSRILLGSDKIGAGMDFPNVQLVVQYKCRDLTLVRWEQRRGRGARRSGITALGVILVEKSMMGDDGPTTTAPRNEDPALLDLIHTHDCQIRVIDIWLENPARRPFSESRIPCSQCSNCNPSLFHNQELTWIMETPYAVKNLGNPSQQARRSTNSKAEISEVLKRLEIWRLDLWKMEWAASWPCYGPSQLITDHDLQEIAKRALTIQTIDDLYSFTSIVHWAELSQPLFSILQSIIVDVYGQSNTPVTPDTEFRPTNTSTTPFLTHDPSLPHSHTLPVPRKIHWTAPFIPETYNQQKRRRESE